MSITRRIFLRNGALAVVGTTALPSFLTRAAFGAADPGLATSAWSSSSSAEPPTASTSSCLTAKPSYYAMRPTINIPRKSVLDLDGFFGLHPAMASFEPLWKQKHLAIVHAAGSPDPTRSHFDAQDFMESGTPGVKATDDGWLNRALHELPRSVLPGKDKSAIPRHRARPIAAAHSLRQRAGGRGQQPERFFRGRKESQRRADVQHLRSHVRPVGRHRVARHRPGNLRRGQDAQGRRSRQSTRRPPARTIPRDASATA